MILHQQSHQDSNRTAILWAAVALAFSAAVAYFLIAQGVLGVGDLQTAESPAGIVYICTASYLIGGLLVLLRKRWLLLTGAMINAMVILFFFMAYQDRASVMLSPGGVVTKGAQLLLEAALIYLIATGDAKAGSTALPGDKRSM